jgi:hypothetical protein
MIRRVILPRAIIRRPVIQRPSLWRVAVAGCAMLLLATCTAIISILRGDQ